MNIYQEHGFKDRQDYLTSLCDEYPKDIVFSLAELLGPNEDFDGLVVSLQDYAVEDEEDPYWDEDQYLDDPRHGQATGLNRENRGRS